MISLAGQRVLFFGLGTVSDGKCMVNDLGWFNRLSKIVPEYKKISRLL